MEINPKTRNQLLPLLAITILVCLLCLPFIVLNEYLLLLLILACLLLVILFIKNPLWPVYLMFLFFPFLYLRIEYGEYQVPIADAIGLLGLTAWIIHYLYQIISRKNKFALRDFPAWPFFGFFVLAAGLSLLNSADLPTSLKYFLRPILFLYPVYILYPYNIIKNKQQFFTLSKILAIAGTLSALISLFYISYEIGGVIPRVNPKEFFGLAPLGYNHNPIAETMLAVLPFTFISIRKAKNILVKRLFNLSLILQLFILLFTFSRSGWLAAILTAGIFLFLERKYYIQQIKKFAPLAVLALVALLPLTYLMLELNSSPIATSSNAKRLAFIEKSLEMFSYHPLIGNGIGTFPQEVLIDPFYTMEFGSEGTNEAHGVIWKLIGETGLLGTLAYFSIIAYLALALYWLRKRNLNLGPIDQISLSILIALVIALPFFELFQTNYFNQKMWLPLSAAFIALKVFDLKSKKNARPN